MQKRITLIVLGMACFASSMTAQVSYNHDAAKMNQITVQEIGVGGLTPSLYYDAFHNSYQKSAASKNKLSFRTLAGISAYQQIEDAEKIDSALTKRAEIEALNIADRTGGALDLAWAAEGDKVSNKLMDFKKNIDRIVTAGGSASDRTYWTEYYNIYQTAIKATRDAYMPNAQRKKEYLRIYEDLCQKNETLVSFIASTNNRYKTSQMLAATLTIPDHKAEIAKNAHGRWKDSSERNTSKTIEE